MVTTVDGDVVLSSTREPPGLEDIVASAATEASDLGAGTVFGRYRIDRFLGRGGMGSVYAAEQLDDGRAVALKVLASGLDSAADRERFLREGRTAASINHPNTVYVYRTEEIDGAPTIAMELVDGGTLEDKVGRQGPLPVASAIQDILAVVDGLDAAHRKGILHRDVKPANCFVGRNGEVKVGDFGLSRPVDRTDEVRLTQTGLFLGTPVFSSPEQLMGEPLDARADIYAVGATLYYLLSGKLPYESDNAVRLVAVVLSGAAIPLESRRPDLPPKLCALVMKCLARKRDDRFADYASLREALQAFQPVATVPAPLGRRLAAGIADAVALQVLATPTVLVLGIDLSDERSLTFSTMLLGSLIALPLYLTWYGVLEGLFGWSPGKYVAGLRVQRDDGTMPGLARGLIRSSLFWMPAIVGDFAWGLADGQAMQNMAPAIVMYGCIALMFIRARRETGFLSEYDRLTKTRVVRRVGVAAFHRSAVVQRGPQHGDISGSVRIGPYAVLDEPGPAEQIALGFDQELGRRVWIRRCDAGDPPTQKVERDSTRANCLRWLGGQRTASGGWDAFAAVGGQPLADRLGRAADWAVVSHWLQGLVTELEARAAAHWPAQQLSINHIWITEDEDAVILPFSVGTPAEGGGADLLLQRVSATVVAADERVLTRQAWPLRSRTVLATIASPGTTVASARALLEAAADRAESFARPKRLWLWAGTFGPGLIFATMIGGVMLVGLRREPELTRLSSLIDYLRSARSRRTENLANRETVAVYVAGHFRQRVAARPRPTMPLISSADWIVADSVVAAHPTVSTAELAAADRLVESTWHGIPPGQKEPGRMVLLIFPIVGLGFSAFASLAASLLARRGLVLRLLGLEIVTTRGRPAGRVRLVWRQIVMWIAPTLLIFTALTLTERIARPIPIALAVLGTVLAPLALYIGLRTPERSLAERLSGTIVVPE